MVGLVSFDAAVGRISLRTRCGQHHHLHSHAEIKKPLKTLAERCVRCSSWPSGVTRLRSLGLWTLLVRNKGRKILFAEVSTNRSPQRVPDSLSANSPHRTHRTFKQLNCTNGVEAVKYFLEFPKARSSAARCLKDTAIVGRRGPGPARRFEPDGPDAEDCLSLANRRGEFRRQGIPSPLQWRAS